MFINRIKNLFLTSRKRLVNYIGGDYPSDNRIVDIFNNRDENSIITRLRNKKQINVAFFCMSISLWKYETLFIEMIKDSCFNPIFFISPKYDFYKAMNREVRRMKQYCKDQHFDYVNMKSVYLYKGVDLKKYNIDIAFYTQSYSRIVCRDYYYDKMKDALLCYTPYGYLISKMEHNYVSLLNKIAWKNFCPTTISKETALLFDPACTNLVDLGYLGYDMYLKEKPLKWGKEGHKKIIWAPHYSIDQREWIRLSSFLEICDFMIEIANKYRDKISFAFKPHPYLYPRLCAKWGQQKTDAYYTKWEKMDNCILHEGNAYSLFKSSDAMIHDSASFLLDYMYTQKPCLYISFSGRLNVETAQDGMDAYEAHYHAKRNEEIDSFINDIVLKEEDPLSVNRHQVLTTHIKKNGVCTTKSILANIKESIA